MDPEEFHEKQFDFYDMFGNTLGRQKTCVPCQLSLLCMLRILDGNAFFRCRHCNQVNFVTVETLTPGSGVRSYCIRVPAPCPLGVRLGPSSTYCDECRVAIDKAEVQPIDKDPVSFSFPYVEDRYGKD